MNYLDMGDGKTSSMSYLHVMEYVDKLGTIGQDELVRKFNCTEQEISDIMVRLGEDHMVVHVGYFEDIDPTTGKITRVNAYTLSEIGRRRLYNTDRNFSGIEIAVGFPFSKN